MHVQMLEEVKGELRQVEAYDELKEWLAKTYHQLQNPDLITGEWEQVTALLAKHKV